MRKWWVWVLCSVMGSAAFPAAQTPAHAPASALSTVKISNEIRAALTSDYQLEVIVHPHRGDAWTRLAKRVTGDASTWEEIAQFNGSDDNLPYDRSVHVPFNLLRGSLQREIIGKLFPNDRPASSGWRHTVVGGRGIEGESLWNISEWFTGDGANYTAIRKANPAQGLSTRTGDVILVPKGMLTAAFGGEPEGENAPKTASEVRKQGDDQAQRSSADEDVPEAAALPSVGIPALTYERSTAEPYAIYRLQKGEALYSSVAIRFTGRVYAKDVGDVVERVVKFNAIEDVSKIPVGYPVRIPMDLLLPEYLPHDDPTRLAQEASQRASAKLARRTRARNLAGVTIVLDAGHGGDDPGATHDGVYESSYVYDVMCRIKEVIEKKSGAKVFVTTMSNGFGFEPRRSDVLPLKTDHCVLTTPKYELEDAVIGVNLRWYLANSIFRRAMKGGVAKEKVVFISIHADSLHPALRGAMAYIPGSNFVQGSYEKRGAVYLARQEVRERPMVRHSEDDALEAEGLSRDLGESIIDAFENAGLRVHPFNPVRDNVVRGGHEWVPAVIRYNMIPTRLLLEICNLGNRRDRELIQTRKYRQQVAEAVYRGVVDFFEQSTDERPAGQVAARQTQGTR